MTIVCSAVVLICTESFLRLTNLFRRFLFRLQICDSFVEKIICFAARAVRFSWFALENVSKFHDDKCRSSGFEWRYELVFKRVSLNAPSLPESVRCWDFLNTNNIRSQTDRLGNLVGRDERWIRRMVKTSPTPFLLFLSDWQADGFQHRLQGWNDFRPRKLKFLVLSRLCSLTTAAKDFHCIKAKLRVEISGGRSPPASGGRSQQGRGLPAPDQLNRSDSR